MLQNIEVTRFDLLPTGWRKWCGRAVDHHVGRIGVCGDFGYYDPLRLRKKDEVTAWSRALTVPIVPVNSPTSWEHDEKDVERVPCDTSLHYRPGIAVYPPPLPEPPIIPGLSPLTTKAGGNTNKGVHQRGPSTGMTVPSVLAAGYTAGKMVSICRFILKAGVLSWNDDVTKIADMSGFVRGRML